jgi:hypothetical protein
MKQTAVEWLYDRFLFAGYAVNSEWKEQAKEMEKEQMLNAFEESRLTHPMIGFKHETFEDYYNETFNTTTKTEQTQTN